VVPLAHIHLRVLCALYQAVVNGVALGNVHLGVIQLARAGVQTSVAKTADALVLGLLEEYHKGRLHAHGAQQVDLGLSLGETVEDPSVNAAVTLANAGVDEAEHDLVGDLFTALDCLLDLDLDTGVFLGFNLDELGRAHIHNAESFSKQLGLGRAARAGWAEEDDPWGSAGSAIAVSELEHLVEVLLGVANGTVGVELEDELLETVANGVDVHGVVGVDLDGEFRELSAVDLSVLNGDLALDALKGECLADVQVDELVGNNTEAL
jgi:hypothetical protein